MSPPIAILGAGPSGLLLARLLEIHNFDYVVYDQNGPEYDPNDHATFDCHPDGVQLAIKEAGLYEEFQKVARFEVQHVGAFDHRGEVITTNDLDMPSIDWCDLRSLLINSLPKERIHWHSKIDKVEKSSDGSSVEVTFDDGKIEKDFKLVVGADGVFSKVRHLVTSVQPKYFGVTYLRTSISLNSRFWSTVQGQLQPTSYFAVGQRKQLIAQHNVAGTYTIYIGLQLPEDWYDPAVEDADGFRERLISHEMANYKSSVLNFVRYSDGPFQIWRHYTMPSDSLSWKSVPGVALVGDAAHPTLPWPGEHVSAVLLDSLQLGQQIIKFGMEGLNQAVTEYETVMFPRRKKYIDKCLELGELFYSRDAVQSIEFLLGPSMEEE